MCRDNITLEKMKADTRFEARNVMERQLNGCKFYCNKFMNEYGFKES